MTDHATPRGRGIRHRVRATVPRLSRFAVEHLLLLPAGVLVALAWVNIAPESYYRTTFAMAFAVNAIAIAFFFAIITKEIVEATAPGGVLHPWRRALLPVVATLGVAAVPALLQMQLAPALDEPMLATAWPVTLTVDLAVVYFMARLAFRQHPAIPFLLLLGIVSNGFAFVALAVVTASDEVHVASGALIIASGIGLAAALRRWGVRSFWPYVFGAGVVSWLGFYRIGLQPALALVPIMPFLPHAARDPGFFVDARPDAPDALSQFEVWWKYPAQVALFFFGLVNAGVPMGALEAGTWGLPLAVVVGKPIGLLLGAGLALVLGLHLPHRIGWRELIVAGLIAAIGLSVGLFLTAALIGTGQLRSEVSMGVLLSLAGGPLALLAARLLRVGRFSSG
jgi:NhaA family Na+:H+ antiporter